MRRRTYSRTPTQLRRLARETVGESNCYQFRLAYRPPYDWDAIIGFLAARAVPGIEAIDSACYRRSIAIGGRSGSIAVSPLPPSHALLLDVRFPDPQAVLGIVERVKRMFDVAADPALISSHLSAADPLLKRAASRHAGIRVPGAWDPFEVAVRAILGQQVSVTAATTIAGRVATRWGLTPAALVDAPLEDAGIIRTRSNTIRALAREVIEKRLTFDGVETVNQLRSIAGIGDWTAQYIAMRALNEPDAFPTGDLVLRRAAGDCSARELAARSEAWRPWRAYAVMLLWQSAVDSRDFAVPVRSRPFRRRSPVGRP